MSLEIRSLTAAELPLLFRLFDYNDPNDMLRENRRRMEAGTLEIFVLFLNGTLTGELHVSYAPDAPAEATGAEESIPGKRAYLFAYRVHIDAQGKKLGQTLLDAVLRTLEARGYTEFTIAVEDDNHLARHIYEKFGFTERLARCSETYQGDSYEYDLLIRRNIPGTTRPTYDQNIFDDPLFFDGYRKLRENPASANELVEKPALFSLCPDLTGKTVLDMGCGFGENCREFARRGAVSVLGIDISEKMLAAAQRDNTCANVRFLRCSMSALDALPGQFDVIFSSLAVHYIRDFPALAHAAYAHLNPGGILIFSQEHPLTTALTEENRWETDADGNVLHYRLTHYGDPGERKTSWFVDGIVKYHRTFSEILNALCSAGFRIETVLEPMPTPETEAAYPKYRKYHHKPDFLLIRARKN